MNERECLVKAQEAEAFAAFFDNPWRIEKWESIARTYRRLAKEAANLRKALAEESSD